MQLLRNTYTAVVPEEQAHLGEAYATNLGQPVSRKSTEESGVGAIRPPSRRPSEYWIAQVVAQVAALKAQSHSYQYYGLFPPTSSSTQPLGNARELAVLVVAKICNAT